MKRKRGRKKLPDSEKKKPLRIFKLQKEITLLGGREIVEKMLDQFFDETLIHETRQNFN
jgi:hypothetical protein